MAQMKKRKKASKKPSDIDKEISMRIKDQRIKLGLTQEEVANELGTTFQQYQKYEYAKNRIAASRLVTIAAVLEVSVGYLVGERELGQ